MTLVDATHPHNQEVREKQWPQNEIEADERRANIQ